MWKNLKQYYNLDRETSIILVLIGINIVIAKLFENSMSWCSLIYTLTALSFYIWHEFNSDHKDKSATAISSIILAVSGIIFLLIFSNNPIEQKSSKSVSILWMLFGIAAILCQNLLIIFFMLFPENRNYYSLILLFLGIALLVFILTL